MVNLSELNVGRRGLLLGGLSAGVLGLAGCGGPAPKAAAGDESGELTVVTPIFEGNDGKQLLEKLMADFTKQHPKITVRADYTSYSKLNEKLTTSIVGGKPYDIMIMGAGWVPPFATKNVLMDLEMDKAKLAAQYNERVLSAGIYEDKVYGLPIMLDTRFGYYRKDFFEKAGLDPAKPPTSFAEMREFARKLTVRSGGKLTRAGLDILSLDIRQVFEPLMWAAGGELFTPDGKAAFNSAEGVAGLQFMADIILTDKSEDFGFSEPLAATGVPIVQGRAAMMLGHNNTWLEFEASNPKLITEDKVGFFVITDERPALLQGGSMATVAARTKLPNAAKALATYLASPEPALAACEQRGNVPAALSSADSAYVKGNEAVQFAVANLEYAYSEGGVPNWLDIRGDFKAAIESVLLGQTSAQKALDELATKADSKR